MRIKTTLIITTIFLGAIVGLSFAYPVDRSLGQFEQISESYTSLTGIVHGVSAQRADARRKALLALPARATVTGDRIVRHSKGGEAWWEIDLYWKIDR